jgi:hypothetical protein
VTDDGVPNIASVVLLPEDSVDMYGRYIGQLSLRDGDGEVEIHKGTIDITNNTHHAFVER